MCQCVRASQLLTDQTPDSGTPLPICCHGVVLERIIKGNTERSHQNVEPLR